MMLPLITATLLGDAVLIMKFSGNLFDDIMAISLAVVLSLVTAVILKSFYKYTAVKLIFIPIIVLSALFTIYNFSLFAGDVMLRGTNILFPFAALSGLAFYLGSTDKKAIQKVALVSVAVISVIIIAITLLSLKFMSGKYLLPHKMPELSASGSLISLYLSLTAAFVPILTMVKKPRELVAPTAVFSLCYTLCTLTVLGHFGSEYASTLDYPYAIAVSSAAVGEIFSRLDGFFYFLCFFTALIKSAVCIYALRQIYLCQVSKIKS